MVNEKILIVEDKMIVAENLKNKLEKLGYIVGETVASGEEAIKIASESRPDLILMDIRLEGDIDGIDAANQIKKKWKIPVIYVTAYADDETLRRASITESYGYVLKPFELRELRGNIEMALYKHKAEEELEGYRNNLKKLVKERTNKLLLANKKLNLEINNRKKAEEEIKRMRDNLQNIIDSASEVIISIDKDFKVQTWNMRAELLTGYKRRDIIGKNISKLPVFINSKNLRNNLKQIIQKEKPYSDNLILNTGNNEKRIIKTSCSIIYGENDNFSGVLFVGNDITFDSELHGKLIPGSSYYILGENNKAAFDFFMSLCKADHNGLFISRYFPGEMEKITLESNIKTVILSENEFDGLNNVSQVDDLVNEVGKSCSKNKNLVILLDGVHYFLTKFSFNVFMNIIYRLREIVLEYDSIILLYADHQILDDRQLAILKKEFQPLPDQSIDNVVIDDELYDILLYINNLNQTNNLVNINKLAKHFSIVGKTVTKRLRILEKDGLIHLRKQGRVRLVYVSEKGKTLLNKRQVL
jgi:PAS domain S-box-containing protein